jgi:hypothetical protein
MHIDKQRYKNKVLIFLILAILSPFLLIPLNLHDSITATSIKIGVFSAFVFWIAMVADAIKYSKYNKFAWIWLIFVVCLNWISSIIYFFVIVLRRDYSNQ